MVGLVLIAAAALAGPPDPPCDTSCQRDTARQELESGRTREPIDRLKQALADAPSDRVLTLLLARAYLLDGNLFWAERTISSALADAPGDPELLAWLAAIHLRQGDPELISDVADSNLEPDAGPLETRWRLIGAGRASLAGDETTARSMIELAASGDGIFPEDIAPLGTLRSSLDPWWRPVLEAGFDLGGGWTSNALAGAPTDPGASGEPSGLVLPELRARLAPRTGGRVEPVLDIEVLGNLPLDTAADELSTLLGGLRIAGSAADARRRITVGYRAEVLFVHQESSTYSKAHRLEAEVEWADGRVLFGGAGHREYLDDRRTRWEADAGLGGPIARGLPFPVVAGATLRLADAESPAYDQLGVSAAVSAMIGLGRQTSLQIALSAAWDDYFNSGGAEGLLVFGTEDTRRDLLGRVGLTVWAPEWHGLRPGLELRGSRRDSTADDRPGFDFSYTEWRAVLWLRFNFAAGIGLPSAQAPLDHVPLDWGLGTGAGMEQERIMDLLRRDEELRRGSSCVLP